jgi:PilZ domain
MSPFHTKQVHTATLEKALVARPRRLTLQTPVRYRTKGLGHWHEGIVENLSQSGVLLRGPQQLAEYTLVEMLLDMPEEISDQKNSMVLCQGRIIRRTELCESEFTGMAASILDYKILPPRSAKV